ncbi:MAG: AAA family ATPase, partial [Microscillaceae bacterium]|nr:AAA family ATPase [Microscillaceae bacterium]
MMKLPIGIQDFQELRRGDYLYVDKTQYIHHLVTENKYYFLSRPRRFGKSLLVSTLKELFEGNQELFKGLWIENHWDWTQKNPVLDFRFNNASYKISGLEAFLKDILRIQSEEHQITLRDAPYPSQLEELIKSISQKYGKVVVLIDEYDKPILDYLHDIPQAAANRDILKNFYSVLKPLDPHLRLVLLTGVSKFSRVSIFSELNNLFDLTLYGDYAAMLGYTQQELEFYFENRILELAPTFGGKEALLAEIKKWYNGYSWDGQNYVYNPLSVLNFFAKRQFENFWFETGTPTFLLKLLDRERSYNLDKIKASPVSFNSFELEYISPEALLFQTGYLTIKAIGANQIYTLSYPNYEVKNSLLQYLLAQYSHSYAPRL